jgi:hypothetical protein
VLTLNQIVSQITNLATAHEQIAESGVGDFAEWQAKERTYPILWVFHESTSVNQMEISFSIRLICADRVIVGEEGDDTQGHEQEVISDTLLVLLDFLAYFQQNHSQPYDVVTSATIDPFTERLNDRLAGNSVTIQIRQPFDWNKCQIPQTGASIPPTVDGLTLYNFCDPSVIARLTDEQVACLIAQYNEPCEDATITINSAPFASVPSGGSLNVPVKNSAGTLRGSKIGADWVVPDGSVPVTNTAATPITTIAVPSGNSVPYVIPNVAWTDSDGSAESTPYGQPIVCQAGAPTASVSLALSDSDPFVGDVVVLTATATNFTPTSYQFRIENGTDLALIVTQAGNVYNWTVPTLVGTYNVYVLATDGSNKLYESEPVTIQSSYILDVYPTANIVDFATFKIKSSFTGRLLEVRRTVGATTTAVDIGLDGDFITLNSPVLAVTTGSSTAATLGQFVAATSYANPDGIAANQSAFVVRTYRQSNGALGGVQTTAVNQPRIVNAGVLDVQNTKACLVFSGNQSLNFGKVNGGSKAANYSLFGVGRILGGATSMAWCSSLYGGANANDYLSIFNRNSRPNQYEVSFGEATPLLAYIGASTATVINNTQQLFEQHKTSGVSGIDIHINGGAALAQTLFTNLTNTNSGAEGDLFLGAYGTFGAHLTGSAQMMLAYNANQSANRTGIKALINSILGTSW